VDPGGEYQSPDVSANVCDEVALHWTQGCNAAHVHEAVLLECLTPQDVWTSGLLLYAGHAARLIMEAAMSYAARRLEDPAADQATLTDKNGESYRLRPIRPEDAPSLMRGYDAMSDQAKWFRMLHTVPHLSDAMAQRFCAPDPKRDICFVIEGQGALRGEILGGARIVGHDDGLAEFSVSLRPEAQSLGLAFGALEVVLHAAHRKGFKHVWGTIAVQNAPMVALAQRLGFKLLPHPDDASLLHADIELPVHASRHKANARIAAARSR